MIIHVLQEMEGPELEYHHFIKEKFGPLRALKAFRFKSSI